MIHRLFADSLKLLLDRDVSVEVVGVAVDGPEAIDLALASESAGGADSAAPAAPTRSRLTVWWQAVEELRAVSAAMLIRINNHALVNDLCAYFRRSGFSAQSVGGGMVEIARADAAGGERERPEIIVQLRVWEVCNPPVTTTVIT